jgi:RNA polymerase sigma factor (sigma-70 family)
MIASQTPGEGDARDTDTALARFHSRLPRVEAAARTMHRRLRPGVISLEDLIGCGREGLLRAARSYDPSTATVSFGSWAELRIRSAMINGVRRFCMPRRAWKRVATGESASLEWLDEASATPKAGAEVASGPEECVARAEILARLHEAVGRLSGRERTLIDRHYLSDEPLAETAASMGVSDSWARRLRMQALARLAVEASAWA